MIQTLSFITLHSTVLKMLKSKLHFIKKLSKKDAPEYVDMFQFFFNLLKKSFLTLKNAIIQLIWTLIGKLPIFVSYLRFLGSKFFFFFLLIKLKTNVLKL